ncbi:MAG: SPOR domain-containing protein [Crocinitomicaceae bacterium]|nr:SPOR domain-containing protein [Crocinitomicaceae bacterium]
MTLQHYIAELLKKHNCVVLPDFGGFVGNTIPAKIDVVKNKIYPPFKEVIFNPHLSNNDGLLADYVGKKESLDYPSAVNYIEEEVKRWISALDEGERVNIGELGFLYQNGKAVVFEQNREINLCLAAYGLKPVSFKKAAVEQKPIVAEKEFQETPIEKKIVLPEIKEEKVEKIIAPVVKEIKPAPKKEENSTPIITLDAQPEDVVIAEEEDENSTSQELRRARKNRSWVKYAVAAAIVPFAFYSYWIPMETDFLDTGKIQFADFNPFSGHTDKSYELRVSSFEVEGIPESKSWDELTSELNDDVKIYNMQLAEDYYIPVRLDKEINQETNTEPNLGANFQVIVGCFGVQSNASNLVNDLSGKGYSASIYDQNKGLHRVTAGGFSSKDKAENALSNLRSEGYSGWILKK